MTIADAGEPDPWEFVREDIRARALALMADTVPGARLDAALQRLKDCIEAFDYAREALRVALIREQERLEGDDRFTADDLTEREDALKLARSEVMGNLQIILEEYEEGNANG